MSELAHLLHTTPAGSFGAGSAGRSAPVGIDSLRSVLINEPTPNQSTPTSTPALGEGLEYRPASEQAKMFLGWLQDRRHTGTVPAAQMRLHYAAFCRELSLEPAHWHPLAVELRQILQQPKTYGSRPGHRSSVVFRIPRSSSSAMGISGER